MITPEDMLKVGVAPFVVALFVSAVGWWRGWRWAFPLAAGVGFLVGFGLVKVPALPPVDGVDWLFWAVIPVTGLGVLDAAAKWEWAWGWLLGLVAGFVALVILRPLAGVSLGTKEVFIATASWWVMGVALIWITTFAQRRVGVSAVVASWCIALGGVGVVVMSSSQRTVGMYGLAGAAAVAGVMVALFKQREGMELGGRGVGIVAVSLLAGLLVSGQHYADPGVSGGVALVLAMAPALVMVGAVMPVRKMWVKAVVGVALVAVVVGAAAGPIAWKAKREAEASAGDPYERMYR